MATVTTEAAASSIAEPKAPAGKRGAFPAPSAARGRLNRPPLDSF